MKKRKVEELLIRAQNGDCEAQCRLGDCYFNGDGIAKNDAEAFRWYESSAWGGSMWGKYNYGKCFLTGRGVAQDAGRARHEFRLSADMGNPWALLRLSEMGDADAMYQLGDCYYNSDKNDFGLLQNDGEAFKWYKQSAEKGNAWGCFNVAKCYLEGRGISKNKDKAIQYLQMSANVGNEFAAYLLSLQGEASLSAIRGKSIEQQWIEIREMGIPGVGSVGEVLDQCVEEVKKPETFISVAKDVALWLLLS